jgi:hypothetical protein
MEQRKLLTPLFFKLKEHQCTSFNFDSISHLKDE